MEYGKGVMKGDDLDRIRQKLIQFRKDRDWEQFHKPKDLALSLVLEVAEVLEHFQWKSDEEIKEYTKVNKDEIGKELADVFNWVLLLSHDLNIDILEAAENKIEENNARYPVSKARGRHDKYTEL